MAWTTPHTFTVGETTTAATLNASVSADTNFLHDPPGASYTSQSGGASGFTSSTSGGSPSIFALNLSASITFFDTDSMITDAGTPGFPYFKVNTAGVYLVSLQGQWQANVTGNTRRLAIGWNGAYHCGQLCQNVANVTVEQSVSAMISAAATDKIEPWGAQNTGSALNLFPCTDDSTHEMFTATWISAG